MSRADACAWRRDPPCPFLGGDWFDDANRPHSRPSCRIAAPGPHQPAKTPSIPTGFDLVVLRLDRPLPPSRWAYLELEIPFDTQWPILIGGTKSDLAEFPGQLYLRGQAGWPDQDIFHQLLRRQNLASRIPVIWSRHRATFLGYLALLFPTVTIFAGLGLIVGRRRPALRWPLALLPLPVMVAIYYFYALL